MYIVGACAYGRPHTVTPTGVWEHGLPRAKWVTLKVTRSLKVAKELADKVPCDARVWVEGTSTVVYDNGKPPYDNPHDFEQYLNEQNEG